MLNYEKLILKVKKLRCKNKNEKRKKALEALQDCLLVPKMFSVPLKNDVIQILLNALQFPPVSCCNKQFRRERLRFQVTKTLHAGKNFTTRIVHCFLPRYLTHFGDSPLCPGSFSQISVIIPRGFSSFILRTLKCMPAYYKIKARSIPFSPRPTHISQPLHPKKKKTSLSPAVNQTLAPPLYR